MQPASVVSGDPGAGRARPSPTRSLLVLALGALTYQVAQTALLPAVPQLVAAYHTNASTVAWTFTGFLLSAAVLTTLLGRLGDMFGKRRVLVIALVLVAAGNLLCGVAGAMPVVIAGRALQGAVAGVFPLAFGIIRDEFPPARVRWGIGMISATAGIGAGSGLLLGALLVDHATFHWVFWVTGAMALAGALTAWWLVPESPERRPGRVDVRGAVVLAAGLVLPLLAVTQAHAWGWASLRTLALIAAGLVILAVWVVVERATPEPLANIATLSRPPVLVTNLVTILTGFGMFTVFLLVPQMVQAPHATGYGLGVSATAASLIIFPGALLMMAVGPLSGPLGDRFGTRMPLALGGLVTAAGNAGLGVVHGGPLVVLLLAVVACSGVGLTYGAMPNLIIEAAPPHETGEATGLNVVMRLVGTALGAQVCGSVLAGSVGAGGGLPSADGFRTAFLLCAAVALAGAVSALVIPKVRSGHVEGPGAREPVAPAHDTALAAD
ncbi:MFS transporter [Baekduia soli]|uniref:MFS transporter n=1 Tax=Baekduia soli TaxID=496014 RepID=A0A5B8U1V5_9ACTN|nr:MFS transporter [Baekduia soli]QEC46967.1 MFS transporter [Baekduia soli]